MATKNGKVVTYHEGFPPIKSHNPLNMWSHELTLQIKNLSLLSECQWLQNIKVVTYYKKLLTMNLHELSVWLSCEVT